MTIRFSVPSPRSLVFALAAASSLAAVPASAQFFGGYYNAPPSPYGYGGYGYARPLPPDEIVDRIEDQGFENVRRVRLEGSVYVAEATSEGGIRTRVTVDAYRGRVLDQRPVLAGYPGGARGGSPYEEMSESEMRRRGIVPGPGPVMPGLRPGVLGPPSGAAPFREAARPYAPVPTSPAEAAPGSARPDGALPAPADSRLAPSGGARSETPRREPKREAARSSGDVDGVNPDNHPARTSPKAGGSASRAEPRTRTSPAAPAPAVQPTAPAEPAAPAEAANRPAKPVRVIGGVTQMSEPPKGERGAPPANQSETPAATPAAPN